MAKKQICMWNTNSCSHVPGISDSWTCTNSPTNKCQWQLLFGDKRYQGRHLVMISVNLKSRSYLCVCRRLWYSTMGCMKALDIQQYRMMTLDRNKWRSFWKTVCSSISICSNPISIRHGMIWQKNANEKNLDLHCLILEILFKRLGHSRLFIYH